MDEQTIKVLARFVEVGQDWPMNSWVYEIHKGTWFLVDMKILQPRFANEICELEANQKGIFRKGTENEKR
jgi:hypothetical protein